MWATEQQKKENTMTDATLALTNGHIAVGNSSNVAADVAMSGDATIDNTGAVTVNNLICLDDFHANSGNTHTDGTLDALYTYTLPGNTLANNGDKLEMEFALQINGTADGSQYFESNVTFNGSFISNDWAENYFGSTGGNTSNVNVRVLLIRVSNSVVRATSTTDSNITVQLSPVTLVFPQAEPPGSFNEITGLDLSTSYDIVLQAGNSGTGAAAGNITAKMGSIRKIKAAA
jgi:hypothetical protein